MDIVCTNNTKLWGTSVRIGKQREPLENLEIQNAFGHFKSVLFEVTIS